MDKTRVDEAQANVRSYLAEGLLKKTSDSGARVILLKNSQESLKVAEILLQHDYSYLWTIVCSYYTMYYLSKVVLLQLGYKVGDKISHKVTADALIVFVRDKLKKELLEGYEEAREEALDLAGLKADELVASFDFERIKRSRLQYSLTEEAKKSKAATSLERAKRFAFELEKLLL